MHDDDERVDQAVQKIAVQIVAGIGIIGACLFFPPALFLVLIFLDQFDT